MAISEATPVTYDHDRLPAPKHYSLRRRLFFIAAGLVVLLLLVLLPPFINVSRYQRRIASSISGALGRPVHLDRVHVTLFPFPGLMLENVVISEDPRYGFEPIIRSNSVRATLRVSSLWRGRPEFGTISFEEPSVNLVRNAAGEWNIQSILRQASQIESAPTQQKNSGSAPRFPYIEATDARVNLKLRDEKTPFSLTQAEFALWQPEPGQWKLRLQAHPLRTDTNTSGAGDLRVEATLGRSSSQLAAPIQLQAELKPTPLGEASKLLIADDAGWRGNTSVLLTLNGTLGNASLNTDLRFDEVRRADFVPPHTMQLRVHCSAQEIDLHSLTSISCSAPIQQPAVDQPGVVTLTGDITNVDDLDSGDLQLRVADLPADAVVDIVRLFSIRIPDHMRAGGVIAGKFVHTPSRQRSGDTHEAPLGLWSGSASCHCMLELPYSPPADKLPAKAVRAHTIAQLWMLPTVITINRADKVPWGMSIVPLTGSTDELGIERAYATGSPSIPSGERIDIQLDRSGYRLQTFAANPPALLNEIIRRFPPLGDDLTHVLPAAVTPSPHLHYAAARSWGEKPVWNISDGAPAVNARQSRRHRVQR